MIKKKMAKEIIKNIKEVKCSISKVYGVSNGVGYDLKIKISTENINDIILQAHALPSGWAYPGHLRPNNPYYKYTGSNDIYQERVIEFWERLYKVALFEFFMALKKDDLKQKYEFLKGEKNE